MTPSARIASAIDILDLIERDRRPAADVLMEWGRSNRFAGSGDRAAIAGLVYDCLRVRRSSEYVMGGTGARAMMLGMLRDVRGVDLANLDIMFSGQRFAPAPLSLAERQSFEAGTLDDASADIRGNVPEWLLSAFTDVFGDQVAEEGQGLSTRAALDVRVNALKALRPNLLAALSHMNATPAPYAPLGIRIAMPDDGRKLSLEAEPVYLKGQLEIQDEGSQLVSLLAGAMPGMQVLDLCAGGGGKSLALAAEMNNKGQIFATDDDARRLAPIHDRIARSGARNIQVRTPRGKAMNIDDLAGRMDLVLVDAPCTGTGTWRRNPDAKWRIRPGSLAERQREQRSVLAEAARHVKPGGVLAYVTCSLLRAENDDQIDGFLSQNNKFSPITSAAVLASAGLSAMPVHNQKNGVLLTPRKTGTDGFYFAALRRA